MSIHNTSTLYFTFYFRMLHLYYKCMSTPVLVLFENQQTNHLRRFSFQAKARRLRLLMKRLQYSSSCIVDKFFKESTRFNSFIYLVQDSKHSWRTKTITSIMKRNALTRIKTCNWQKYQILKLYLSRAVATIEAGPHQSSILPPLPLNFCEIKIFHRKWQ